MLLLVISAFATSVMTGAPERAAAGSSAPQREAASGHAEIEVLPIPNCPGGVRSGAAGPIASCPPVDITPRGPAAEQPEYDLPGWLGHVTGWWGGGSGRAERQGQGFIVAPTIAASPLIGAGFGIATAGSIPLGGDTTRPSTYATSFVVTTNGQFSVPLRTDVTLPGGKWNLVGDWQWSKFPAPTWGLGGNTPASAESVIDHSFVRLHETANRRLVDDLFAGFGLYLDYHYDIHDRGTASGAPSPFSQYPYGTGSTSLSFGPGLNLLWDSRDDAGNATRGVYANFNYAFVPTWLGNATEWQSLYLDVRTYFPLSSRLVLGLWSFGWFAFGNVPYLELPGIGEEPNGRSGRGYIEGRHIGKSLVYGEIELRYTVWQWLGVAGGVNVHSVGQPEATGPFPDEPRFQYWYPAGVAGLRITLVKQTRANIAVDFAVGKASTGFYVNFSETF